LQGEWDYEHFRREHLAAFLGMTEEFERSGEFPEDSDSETGDAAPHVPLVG